MASVTKSLRAPIERIGGPVLMAEALSLDPASDLVARQNGVVGSDRGAVPVS